MGTLWWDPRALPRPKDVIHGGAMKSIHPATPPSPPRLVTRSRIRARAGQRVPWHSRARHSTQGHQLLLLKAGHGSLGHWDRQGHHQHREVQVHGPQLSQPPALSAAPSQVLPVGQELSTPPIPSGCSPLQSCLSCPIPLQHSRCTPESQGCFPVSGPPCWLLPPCSLPAQAPAGLAACLCREDLMLPVPARPYPRAPLVGGCTQSRPWHHWGRGLAVAWAPRRPLVQQPGGIGRDRDPCGVGRLPPPCTRPGSDPALAPKPPQHWAWGATGTAPGGLCQRKGASNQPPLHCSSSRG